MKKKTASQSAFFNLRVLIGFFVLLVGVFLALFATANPPRFGFRPNTPRSAEIKGSSGAPAGTGQWAWQKPLPQGNPLYAASFTDANNGTGVGEGGTILRTTDGGAHWTIQTSGYEGTGIKLLGVSFTDANIGTAVGTDTGTANAIVIRTTDGGNTWVTKYSNSAVWILGVSFSDANTGTVIGV